jgi:sulfate adenylyltransferase subunit 1 (EFTu-like GTPase family)
LTGRSVHAARFRDIEKQITDYLTNLCVNPIAVIPISARQGDGAARPRSTGTKAVYRDP